MPEGVWSVRHASVAAVTCVAQPKDVAANRRLPMECVCAACLIFTLSLALSHKGRGDILFENTDNPRSGHPVTSVPDPCVPSPLAGEGQGEGKLIKL